MSDSHFNKRRRLDSQKNVVKYIPIATQTANKTNTKTINHDFKHNDIVYNLVKNQKHNKNGDKNGENKNDKKSIIYMNSHRFETLEEWATKVAKYRKDNAIDDSIEIHPKFYSPVGLSMH